MNNIASIFTRNYLFIGKKDGLPKRGSYTVAKRLSRYLGIPAAFDTEIASLSELPASDKYIFLHQATDRYSFAFNIATVLKLPHVVYTRKPFEMKLFNSASNGFSFYKNTKAHKNFIPQITDFKASAAKVDEIVIGFYERVNITPDAVRYLQYEIDNSKFPINLVTCGLNTHHFTGIKSHYHTYDNEDFFSRITHYYFPQSAEFVDPFPNTLLEAIQTGKQIICPTIQGRRHVDGIDDLLLFIQYHVKLDDAFSGKFYDNSNHGLTENNFRAFYARVLEAGFSNFVPYDEYKTFYDWCCKEIA